MLPPRGTQEHVAVGNINIDISLRVPRIPGPDENVRAVDYWVGLGGAASNYSIAVARLGQRAVLVARAGREAVALGLLERLAGEGVDTGNVEVVDEPSGVVVVLLVAGEGYRSMVTVRGANEGLRASMLPPGGDVVHLASVPPGLVREACRARRLCTYDPGGEAFRDPEGVAGAARSVDYLFLNSRELEALTGQREAEAATALAGGRLRAVIVKCGGGGAVIVDSSGIVASARPPRVPVVDVTGAGDAFNAAFNMWILWRADQLEALRAAVAAGAAKTARRGSSNMPRPGEVEVLIPRVEVTMRR